MRKRNKKEKRKKKYKNSNYRDKHQKTTHSKKNPDETMGLRQSHEQEEVLVEDITDQPESARTVHRITR
jgi:hypothetical protein